MVTEMVMLNILMMAMMKPAMIFSKCAIQNRCSMSVEIDQMPRSVLFVECDGVGKNMIYALTQIFVTRENPKRNIFVVHIDYFILCSIFSDLTNGSIAKPKILMYHAMLTWFTR